MKVIHNTSDEFLNENINLLKFALYEKQNSPYKLSYFIPELNNTLLGAKLMHHEHLTWAIPPYM
jgi:hypothetical protein